VEGRLRAASTPIRKISLTSIVDEELDVGSDKLDDAVEVFGSPFVAVRFWDMLMALREGLPEEVFSFGHEMQRFELLDDDDTTDTGVRLHFLTTEQTNTEQHDDQPQSQAKYSQPKTLTVKTLIDAGGIRSQTRRQLLNDRPIPRLRATFAVAKATAIQQTGGSGATGDRNLSFVQGNGVSCTIAALQNGDVWWTQTRFSDDPTATLIPTDEPATTMRNRLEERFAAWPATIQGLVRATPSEDIIESTVSELPVTLRWGGRGCVSLMGDAAHAQLPSLGLGISTAFGDVDEFCRQVDRFGLTEKALRRYEFVRIPKTAVLQLASRLVYYANLYIGKE